MALQLETELAAWPSSCAVADNKFGPELPSSECRGGFDFTLAFENIVLSLVPGSVFLVAAIIRLWQLSRARAVSQDEGLQAGKLCTACAHGVGQLTVVVFWALPDTYRTTASLPAAVVNLLAAMAILPLSYWEGRRAPRPSAVLNVYLLGACLFEAVQTRTLWLATEQGGGGDHVRRLAISLSVVLGVKTILLVLEAVPKTIIATQTIPGTQNGDGEEEGKQIIKDKNRERQAAPREQTAGVYARRTFWWLNRILWTGFRNSKLQADDLYEIDDDLRTKRYSEALADAWGRADKNKKRALLLSTLGVLKWPLLIPALPRLAQIFLNLAQPLLLLRVLQHVSSPPSSAGTGADERQVGQGLIIATVLVYFGLAVFNGYYGSKINRAVVLVRGSLIDLIYRHMLELDLTTCKTKAASGPAGLVTMDVERVDLAVDKLHALWAAPIEVGLGIFLLERQVGWACVGTAVVAAGCTLATTRISRLLPSRQKAWNQSVQRRVALTSTALNNIKSIKMMGGFERHVAGRLQAAREAELDASASFRKCMTMVNTLVMVPRQLSAPLVLTLYALGVNNNNNNNGTLLTASRAFTTLALIEIVAVPMGLLLQALPNITSSLACLDRIQAFLLTKARVDHRRQLLQTADMDEKLMNVIAETPDLMASFNNASFSYATGEKKDASFSLSQISMNLPRGSITIVAGPVGSGKSTLLKAILGELEPVAGEVHVDRGPIGFCDQNPWISNGTIRQCIMGNSEYDNELYEDVVHTCALDQDMMRWGEEGSGGGGGSGSGSGSDMNVGSRGMALSEGQKHRLALARALYSRAPLLILDNTFQALDSRTEAAIRDRLLAPISGWAARHGTTVVLATTSCDNVLRGQADQVVVLDQNGNMVPSDEANTLLFSEEQSPPKKNEQIQQPVEQQAKPNLKPNAALNDKTPSTQIKPVVVSKKESSKAASTYRFFFRPVGFFRLAVLILGVVSLAVLTRIQRVWVQWWTEASSRDRYPTFIGVYFTFAVGGCTSFAFVFWWLFMSVTPITAGGLHQQLVTTIFSAPLSYFSGTDSGIILNRFSQDMAVLNGMLPVSIFQTTSTGALIIGQLALIMYGANYMSISLPFTLLTLWLLANFYLRTSRQLRVLELELKAPIYTLLTETMEGLSTIRAFGWQSWYRGRCHERVDGSKRAIYLLFMVQRWLGFVLDCTVAALATFMVILATQLRESTNSASLGVGLSSVIGFSVLVAQLVATYTEVENSLGAVDRIRDCVDTVPSEEDESRLVQPPAEWPTRGHLEFRHVSAGYVGKDGVTTTKVIQDLNFSVKPGQKVWLCGRTGSGKSTILNLLLRLMNASSGEILVDGEDMARISPSAVKRAFAVIPQSPFFLPGTTVRTSLGLYASSSEGDLAQIPDQEMISVLNEVGLWDHVRSQAGEVGLGLNMDQLPLSHGQRQLFGFAMAMLKVKRQGTKIVLMDEPASGCDQEIVMELSALIRRAFENCTVIAVTHSLDMISDEDMVVSLDK
ncbi:uncharacterized protein PpBr36_09792 [Pyricularia pennisetigena]|uniref:uncharacterized protein n=1 Tax=Pyricularia pennisetigena TaxID=1578925 RepID=UPI00115488D6|nr:uncharacterized protein PpBr36_09792 [Pyricularia pennisetigena]TLS22357.1 hypothetical protein PpBr36_09792 [Pyricularia pennisetigena]